MLTITVTARRMSQTKVMGEKTYERAEVPRDCTRNRTTRNACCWDEMKRKRKREKRMLTIEIATMSEATSGFATAIPPTALVTETAGVNTPSASVRLVPNSD